MSSFKFTITMVKGMLQLGLAPDPTTEQDDVWWRPAFAFSSVSLRPLLTHRQPRKNMDHHKLHLEKRVRMVANLICQSRAHWCYKLDGISMGAPVEALAASSTVVERPRTNLVPELHRTPHAVFSMRSASSPEDSDTKTQSPRMPSSVY